MKLTKIEAPVKGISTVFIAGDWHSEALDIPTYKILKTHASLLPKEQRTLIINGDFLDACHLMAKNGDFRKWIKRSDGIDDYFLPLSEEEFRWGNRILDELQSVFNKIIFVYGNHDWRYDWFISQAPPAYSHNFNVNIQLRLDERGIDTVGYNEWLDFGDNLSITHGMYHGSSCLTRHFNACLKNVIFSHVHNYACKAFQVRGNTKQSWSLPSMSHLNPGYVKGREMDWSNGYGVINMLPNSNFNFNVFQVWDGRLVLPDGTILDGR